jgi:hypothetical protein
MPDIKDKKKGYILLLTMIILSSIMLLLLTVINTNQVADGFSSTILKKQEEFILFQSAIAITQSIISQPIERSETDNEKKTTEEKEKQKKSERSYFKLYWQKCNKWLDFTLTEKEHKQEGAIKIYLMIEDGKIPLQKILSEYNNLAKGNKNEENQTNDQSKTEFKNEHEQKTITKKETPEAERPERENVKKKEDILEKSSFFKALFKKISSLEDKNHLFKQLKIKKETRHEEQSENKESFLKRCCMLHIKQKREGTLPLNLSDALPREDIIQKNLFQNEEKQTGIESLFSTENNKGLSLIYASPEVLEFLTGKKGVLTEEARKKILEQENELFSSDMGSEEKTWDTLYKKTLDLPFPKDIIDEAEIKKLFEKGATIPETFSALIKITTISGSLFAFVTFKRELEKNKKDSYEYLLKSVYIIPNT